ncbi:MAG TPA: hypothetical protein VF329_11090 [Gammaproteobacteria bacterium]
MQSSTFTRVLRAAAKIGTISLALALGGCSGSGGSSATADPPAPCDPADAATAAECGTLLVALTDADGDFASYSVDVLSITLHRSDGATVEVLPSTTRIDFAQLVDLSDLLSAVTLAPGELVGGTIRLDYANAEVFVEAGGETVQATVVDTNGEPLGVTELEIRLPDRDRLVVTRGRAAFLTLDFDLAASHEVDTMQSPPVVTAEPYIVAEVSPVVEKELRVRGALVDVDEDAGEYTIAIRPWHRRDGDQGRVTVHTTAATTFEIGDAAYVGEEGLEALAELDPGTLTVAFGTLDVQDREFTAEIVHARESVGGAGVDAVYGHVAARRGDLLTVKGAFVVDRDGGARFRRTVLVDVGPDTRVFKIGDPAQALGDDALSVGQRIVAFGELAPPADPEAPDAAPALDATQGRIRMLVTRLHGTVAAVTNGQLDLELRAIDRLPAELFDFTGTGAAPAVDADPSDYEVATGALSLGALAPGEAASVLGFVTPFGAAPPDFEGRTVVDHRNLPASLGIGWGDAGTVAPFLALEPTGLVLDLANPSIGARHHLRVGRRVVDLLDLPAPPTVAPHGGRALFGLAEPGRVELFSDFGTFIDELARRLAAGDAARALTAHGTYDEAANTVDARYVAVHLLLAE